jgi:hypothetical protein
MSLTLQYLAGFFDGEGCAKMGTAKKNGNSYPVARVLLGQSGPDGYSLLKSIVDIYGGNLYLHLRPGEHKATKNAWKLSFRKLEAIKFLTDIQPFLILKQEDVKKVLEHLTR